MDATRFKQMRNGSPSPQPSPPRRGSATFGADGRMSSSAFVARSNAAKEFRQHHERLRTPLSSGERAGGEGERDPSTAPSLRRLGNPWADGWNPVGIKNHGGLRERRRRGIFVDRTAATKPPSPVGATLDALTDHRCRLPPAHRILMSLLTELREDLVTRFYKYVAPTALAGTSAPARFPISQRDKIIQPGVADGIGYAG